MTPTPEQLAAAKHAGWDVGDDPENPIEPPGGWELHTADPGPVEYLEGPTDD